MPSYFQDDDDDNSAPAGGDSDGENSGPAGGDSDDDDNNSDQEDEVQATGVSFFDGSRSVSLFVWLRCLC